MNLPAYPIRDIREAITSAFDAEPSGNPGLIIEGQPGSGKSTLVPLFLVDRPWRRGRTIIITQPRRAAVLSIALRLRELAAGEYRVGYAVRGERDGSRNADILVVTEGILVRQLIDDPELSDAAAVIIDEYHERSIQADLSLALLRQCAELFRPDLRLGIMSATLDPDLPRRLGMPRLVAEGRPFPVTVRYLPQAPEHRLAIQAARVALEAANDGSVLVFLPGEGEIREAERWLSSATGTDELQVFPLYGRLSAAEQRRAIEPAPDGKTRIVLATNVAETSLTIEGIRCVVDSGLKRSSEYDRSLGINRLVTGRISAAAATQRAGRAGRLGPGTAIRLWSEGERLVPADPPEILREELSPLILALAAWSDGDPENYRWTDPPPGEEVDQATGLLRDLGALEPSGAISEYGRVMARLPLHPRLAALALSAHPVRRDQAAGLAALLENGDPFLPEAANRFGADISVRLDASILSPRELKAGVANLIQSDRKRILTILSDAPASSMTSVASPGIGSLLAAAYPDRIGRKEDDGRYLLAGGGNYHMNQGDGGFAPRWIVAADVHRSARGGRIHLAAALEDHELPPLVRRLGTVEKGLELDDRRRLRAREIRRLGVIELDRRPVSLDELDDLSGVLTDLVKRQGVDILPWNDRARGLQARLTYLHEVLGDPWPPADDETLTVSAPRWLPSVLPGKPGPEALASISMTSVLQSLIPWDQFRRLDELAPENFELPSGSRQKLRYEGGKAILSARIQQLFGLRSTPLVAGRRMEIELLSPARRPVQITADLEGFWNTTYQEVRRELRGRYPKHYWPEDPFSARATDGTRP
jgi:ATP-dependent helicase HrpB